MKIKHGQDGYQPARTSSESQYPADSCLKIDLDRDNRIIKNERENIKGLNMHANSLKIKVGAMI